ncbi:MAG: hypothetical protein KKG59_03860 [Nanoarchaeota archaeon]|nr:hypothetical protein [Nanoarchaeota archaeon]
MNQKELLLMSYFRRNSRTPLTSISRKTRIPVSTIYDKLKEFEKKLIHKHTTLLDFKKLGYDVRVNMLIKTADKEKMQNFLSNENRINNVFRLAGEYSFMIEGIFRDIQDLNDFSEKLETFQILERKEFFILEDIKKEAFLTNSDLLPQQPMQ